MWTNDNSPLICTCNSHRIKFWNKELTFISSGVFVYWQRLFFFKLWLIKCIVLPIVYIPLWYLVMLSDQWFTSNFLELKHLCYQVTRMTFSKRIHKIVLCVKYLNVFVFTYYYSNVLNLTHSRMKQKIASIEKLKSIVKTL